MIHDMYIDNALSTIVEAMLPKFSPANIGLLVQLDLRASNNKMDKTIATLVTFIFQRPSNYTKVLVKRTDFHEDPWLFKDKEIVMDLASDHDSCWRSDGFLILNKDWDEKVHILGHPARNKNVYFHNSFSVFEPIKYLKFKKFEVDRDERKVNFIIEDFISTEEILKGGVDVRD